MAVRGAASGDIPGVAGRGERTSVREHQGSAARGITVQNESMKRRLVGRERAA